MDRSGAGKNPKAHFPAASLDWGCRWCRGNCDAAGQVACGDKRRAGYRPSFAIGNHHPRRGCLKQLRNLNRSPGSVLRGGNRRSDPLHVAARILDADDVWVQGQYGNELDRHLDRNELGNVVEDNRERRAVGDAAEVMKDCGRRNLPAVIAGRANDDGVVIESCRELRQLNRRA